MRNYYWIIYSHVRMGTDDSDYAYSNIIDYWRGRRLHQLDCIAYICRNCNVMFEQSFCLVQSKKIMVNVRRIYTTHILIIYTWNWPFVKEYLNKIPLLKSFIILLSVCCLQEWGQGKRKIASHQIIMISMYSLLFFRIYFIIGFLAGATQNHWESMLCNFKFQRR